MKLEYFILGITSINPMTGYDIKKYLDTEGRFGRARAPLSQIYTTLKRMVEQDWIMYVEEKRENKPDIKIYHNTKLGKEVLLEYLHSPINLSFRFKESETIDRIKFSFLVKPEVIIEQVQTELNMITMISLMLYLLFNNQSSKLLSIEDLAYTQEIYENIHRIGTRAIDDYVLSLEEMIKFFIAKKEHKND